MSGTSGFSQLHKHAKEIIFYTIADEFVQVNNAADKAYSFQERNIPFICIKPKVDTRNGVNTISSRIGISRPCTPVSTDTNIFDYIQNAVELASVTGGDKFEWVLVDEAQFLTSVQVEQLAAIVDELDINVMCYGLRTDFQTKLFEGSKRLLELADNIEELKISCECGRKAIVNTRIDKNGEIVLDGEQIEIGGNDRYISLCRRCYHKLKREKEQNF